MKIELGCGERPTEGYLHQDVIQLSTPLDFLCNAWELPCDNNSVDEIIAIAMMEHLRYSEFTLTVSHIYKILKPGGMFLFDVPDLVVWNEYLYKLLRGEQVPFSEKHIFDTMWGWQRWPGDEHKSMWTRRMLVKECEAVGFDVSYGLPEIRSRVWRERFSRPENAHIYIKAVK